MTAKVSGTFTVAGNSAWTTPRKGSPFNVTVEGTFSGVVQLVRSFDGGVTRQIITKDGVQAYYWTSPASEQVEEPESGVLYRLECLSLASGSIPYRISW
jgi:hypothetical protein